MLWNVDIVNIYFEHPVFYLKIYKCIIQNIIVRIEIKFDTIWCCGLTMMFVKYKI